MLVQYHKLEQYQNYLWTGRTLSLPVNQEYQNAESVRKSHLHCGRFTKAKFSSCSAKVLHNEICTLRQLLEKLWMNMTNYINSNFPFKPAIFSLTNTCLRDSSTVTVRQKFLKPAKRRRPIYETQLPQWVCIISIRWLHKWPNLKCLEEITVPETMSNNWVVWKMNSKCFLWEK